MADIKYLEIEMDDGCKLVAEKSVDPYYPNEIYVSLNRPDGSWWQDLVVVRRSESEDEDKYEILVYADENNEDYTHKFIVGMHQEDYLADENGEVIGR